MKLLFVVIINLLAFNKVMTQETNFSWAKTFGGSGYIYEEDFDFDNNGNIYITGYFEGTIDVDPGASKVNLTSVGKSDMVIIKLNDKGEYVWAKNIGSSGLDSGQGLKVTLNGDVIITGFFELTVDFDPSANKSELKSNGSKDVFILKMDKDGNYKWAVSLGNNSLQEGSDIEVDKLGNIIAVGNVSGTIDFDPGSGKFEIFGGSVWDAYVLKLDANGKFIWAKRIGSGDNDTVRNIVLDSEDNIVISGTFSGTVDFDPGSNTVNKYGAGTADAYALKLTKDGNFVWVHNMTGSGFDTYLGMDIDKNNNIALVLLFTDNIDMNPSGTAAKFTSKGAEDVIVMKLKSNGNMDWAKQIGGENIDWCHDVNFDNDGNVLAVGFFYNDCFFGDNNHKLTSNGIEDGFLSKFSSSGNIIWEKQIGGKSSDGLNLVKVNGNNEIFLGGNAYGKVDLNPESGVYNYTPDGTDAYIVKLDQNTTSTFDQSLQSFIISPNPTKDFFVINNTNNEISTISIFDLQGRMSKSYVNINNLNYFSVLDLKAGIYLVQIRNLKGVIGYEKLIVQN